MQQHTCEACPKRLIWFYCCTPGTSFYILGRTRLEESTVCSSHCAAARLGMLTAAACCILQTNALPQDILQKVVVIQQTAEHISQDGQARFLVKVGTNRQAMQAHTQCTCQLAQTSCLPGIAIHQLLGRHRLLLLLAIGSNVSIRTCMHTSPQDIPNNQYGT